MPCFSKVRYSTIGDPRSAWGRVVGVVLWGGSDSGCYGLCPGLHDLLEPFFFQVHY